MNVLNLPQRLVDLDESKLPESVRAKVADLVRRGFKREVLMVSRRLDVHVSEELAAMHAE